MAFEHDRRYKYIFSQHYFLQKLLESFVHEDFISALDFNTLKRIDKSFINGEFKEKESDLIFTINYKNQSLYIFLLIEFQSTVDKLMPVRFLRYIMELYESNRRLFSKKYCFPAVFPLLLYSGDPKWTAEYEISRIIEKTIPCRYVPHFRYYPICENEIPKISLFKIKNAVSAIFYIENSSPEELQLEIDRLVEIISGEDLEIMQEFAGWFNNYLAGVDDFSEKDLLSRQIENAVEAKAMFATKLKEYEKKLLAKGREEGLRYSVKQLKLKGVPESEISRLLDISISEIKKL